MNSLALQVQEKLGRDPHAGDLYVFRGQTRPTSDIQHTVFALPGLPIPGIRCSGGRCRYRRTVAGRICNVSTRTNGQTLAASCRPGCSMRATAQAWLSASRRSASKDYSSLPPLWSRSTELRRMAHDRHPSRRKEKDRAEKPYRNPSAACSLSRTSNRRAPAVANPEGAHRSFGRSSPRGHRCPAAADDEGRR